MDFCRYQQLQSSHKKGWSKDTTGLDPWEGDGATHGPGSAQRLSMDEIRSQQQDMIAEQDKGLDHLSRALRRQQEVGLAIQGEITEHNGQCTIVCAYVCVCANILLQDQQCQ